MTALRPSVPALLSLAAGGLTFGLVRWSLAYRDRPGGTYWIALQVTIGVWAVATGVGFALFDRDLRLAVEPVVWLCRSVSAVLLVSFVLAYLGWGDLLDSVAGRALWLFPLVAYGLYLTNAVHGLLWREVVLDPVFGAAALDRTFGVGFYAVAAVTYVLATIAVVRLFASVLKHTGPLSVQTGALAVAFGAPTVADVVWSARVGPTDHLAITQIAFAVTAVAGTYALFETDMFELIPATSRIADDVALEDISTAVVSLSPTGRVVDYNRAAADTLGFGTDSYGADVGSLLDVDVPLEETSFRSEQLTDDGRVFEVVVSPVSDAGDRAVGFLLNLYDVTEKQHRRQRLSVQNRLLRHNLQNALTVILGATEQARRETDDGDTRRALETAIDRAEHLASLGEKIRAFDQALAGRTRRVAAASVLGRVTESLREQYATAAVTVEASDSPTLSVNAELLGIVLRETIENAIQHGSDTTVRVRVESDGTGVTFVVSDDGPGIPEHELDALRADRETPLQHASSVGLWIVVWGTERLGGRALFDTSDAGTSVRIRLDDVLAGDGQE